MAPCFPSRVILILASLAALLLPLACAPLPKVHLETDSQATNTGSGKKRKSAPPPNLDLSGPVAGTSSAAYQTGVSPRKRKFSFSFSQRLNLSGHAPAATSDRLPTVESNERQEKLRGRLDSESPLTAESLERLLTELGVEAVAIDFDRCLIPNHFKRGFDEVFVPQPTPDAQSLLLALAAAQKTTWVASFKDTTGATVEKDKPQYDPPVSYHWPTVLPRSNEISDDATIVGRVIMAIEPAGEQPLDVKIVSFFPPSYPDDKFQNTYGTNKVSHLQIIGKVEGLQPEQILLIDDNRKNIEDAISHGFLALWVHSTDGLKFDKLEAVSLRKNN